MATPWFDPNTFGMWFGVIGGGVGGSLLGVLGGLAGYLIPRGKGRRWIFGTMYAVLAIGATCLVIGLYALATGQPYGIWYPLILSGAIISLVLGINIPIVGNVARQAEQRRIEAEGLRSR